MGTMIQRHELQEADYRGARFAEGYDACSADGHAHGPVVAAKGHDQRGNNDLLSRLTRTIIRGIHRHYLAGRRRPGRDQYLQLRLDPLADYGLQHLARELNREGRGCASAMRRGRGRDPSQPRFAIGVLGPTSRTASLSPDVNRPGFRAIDFDELAEAYREARGLVEGGADILMVETVFDTSTPRRRCSRSTMCSRNSARACR